jgi:pullulanase/glycogen debranching enzyme
MPTALRRTLLTTLAGVLACASLSACGGGGGGGGGGTTPPPANLVAINHAKAAWLNASTISWPGASSTAPLTLYYAAHGGMTLDVNGNVTGADGNYTLTAGTLASALASSYPLWSSGTALTLPGAAQSAAGNLLKDELLVVSSATGAVQGTHLQIQGVLDATYASAAANQAIGLGFTNAGAPVFNLWAPTAQNVALTVNGTDYAMTANTATGIWSYTGPATWNNNATYYNYKVTVYNRTDNNMVNTYVVSDPYANSLNADVFGGTTPQQALIVDLNSTSTSLAPTGWASERSPNFNGNQDAVVYELHLRDFSDNDPSLSDPTHAGKFLAFTETTTNGLNASTSNGMAHLSALAAAGVTHVHLLPVFDIASINEGGCTTPTITNTGSGAAISQLPQATVIAAQGTDCFNWGYDPKHYGAPEGSYASSAADGTKRVLEFRSMVASLHAIGLRVVMDVVYNHMSSNYLDQIVPGYYYRMDTSGNIENYSCCTDTATEFAFAARLMTDTLTRWAVQYHVDGYRFDIMSFTPKAQLLAARTTVDAAASNAGRDPLLYYGEGWNTGGTDVANDARFVMARQGNLSGTNIGTFNDRMRDAIRGGGPFDSAASYVTNQGFASGLCYDPNANNVQAACPASTAMAQTSTSAQLYAAQNLIRLSMAGNLAGYSLNGTMGSAYNYGGQAAGYAASPVESINYAGVHDNETLWDISQYKHPTSTTSADRARAQVVALAPVLLGQGIPFIHAGDELLRTKSMDRDSYNAGDWFNRIDWSGTTNYAGTMGMPLSNVNQSNWPTMTPVLSNPLTYPATADIQSANGAILDLLRIRKSTSMFRLGTAAAVNRCISFPDAASQLPGLIVMQVGGTGLSCGDNAYRSMVVVINANKTTQSYAVPAYAARGANVSLHPQQAAGSDSVVKNASFASNTGTFTVPPRSAAVFVEN